MDNVIEVVALLRKHWELELQILNGYGAAVAIERKLEATVRRLADHPPGAQRRFADGTGATADTGYRVSKGRGGLELLGLT
jgi:hypothetical protein